MEVSEDLWMPVEARGRDRTEGNTAGRGRLQIGLQELELPARPQEEVNADMVATPIVAGHAHIIRRIIGEKIHGLGRL